MIAVWLFNSCFQQIFLSLNLVSSESLAFTIQKSYCATKICFMSQGKCLNISRMLLNGLIHFLYYHIVSSGIFIKISVKYESNLLRNMTLRIIRGLPLSLIKQYRQFTLLLFCNQFYIYLKKIGHPWSCGYWLGLLTLNYMPLTAIWILSCEETLQIAY